MTFGGVLGRPLDTLSFGPSQFHGHGSWLVCEVALSMCVRLVEDVATLAHAGSWDLQEHWVLYPATSLSLKFMLFRCAVILGT
jgi:hypothetical protein